MINETIMNIDAIMPYIIWFGVFIVIGIALFLLHNLGNIKIFSKHDNKMVNQFLDKFPLVSPEFYKKTKIEQLAENNQEIHEINKRLDLKDREIEELKANQQRIIDILEELQNNGNN